MQTIDELQALAAKFEGNARFHEDFARSTKGKNKIYHIKEAERAREQVRQYHQMIARRMEKQDA